MTQEELIDERAKARIERIEREKAKQNRKHQDKIENVDWLSKLNKGEEHGRRTEIH
jgi:hypothetical protein